MWRYLHCLPDPAVPAGTDLKHPVGVQVLWCLGGLGQCHVLVCLGEKEGCNPCGVAPVWHWSLGWGPIGGMDGGLVPMCVPIGEEVGEAGMGVAEEALLCSDISVVHISVCSPYIPWSVPLVWG